MSIQSHILSVAWSHDRAYSYCEFWHLYTFAVYLIRYEHGFVLIWSAVVLSELLLLSCELLYTIARVASPTLTLMAQVLIKFTWRIRATSICIETKQNKTKWKLFAWFLGVLLCHYIRCDCHGKCGLCIILSINPYSKSMAWCKTAVSPLLTHWSYCSPVLSHRNRQCIIPMII